MPTREPSPNTEAAQKVVQDFAGELARLRELHGNPSFQRMADNIRHVHDAAGSKNTFHRMISKPERIYEREYVRGFVIALGLSDREADEWELRRFQTMRNYQDIHECSAAPAAEPRPARRWHAGRGVRVSVILAVGIIAAMTSGFLIVANSSPSSPVPLANGGLPQPRDGADPKDSGCSLDPRVATLSSAEVDYGGRPVGLDELRYSPGCGVAWARFSPFPAARIPYSSIIQVNIFRPASHNLEESFQAPYAGAQIYGNVLRSTVGCVYASVSIDVAGRKSPASRTWCFRGKTPQQEIGAGDRHAFRAAAQEPASSSAVARLPH